MRLSLVTLPADRTTERRVRMAAYERCKGGGLHMDQAMAEVVAEAVEADHGRREAALIEDGAERAKAEAVVAIEHLSDRALEAVIGLAKARLREGYADVLHRPEMERLAAAIAEDDPPMCGLCHSHPAGDECNWQGPRQSLDEWVKRIAERTHPLWDGALDRVKVAEPTLIDKMAGATREGTLIGGTMCYLAEPGEMPSGMAAIGVTIAGSDEYPFTMPTRDTRVPDPEAPASPDGEAWAWPDRGITR